MTIRVDALFSRFLGATAQTTSGLFLRRCPGGRACICSTSSMPSPKARGDSQDVGEMSRIVTAFLQLIDADVSGSLLIAATNHSQLLDHAVFRRFDLIVPFQPPDPVQIEALLRLRLRGVRVCLLMGSGRLPTAAAGLSYADVARACDDAIRSMALDGHEAGHS